MPSRSKHTRNKNSSLGIRRFNKVVSETRKAAKQEGKSLSFAQARKYVSEYVYPSLKKIPTYKLHKTVINKKAKTVFKHVPPEETEFIPKNENVDYLNWAEMIGIEFYELEEVITTVVPKQMIVQINAGQFGIVRYFKAGDFKKIRNEWVKIREDIREIAASKENPSGKSGSFYFAGILFHLKGKPDNKSIKNNGIEFDLLSDEFGEVFKPLNEIQKNRREIEPKGERKKGTKKRKLSEKLKEKKKENTREHRRTEELKKKLGTSKGAASEILKIKKEEKAIQKSIEREINTLFQAYKEGIYTKKEFKEEREKIINRFKPNNKK